MSFLAKLSQIIIEMEFLFTKTQVTLFFSARNHQFHIQRKRWSLRRNILPNLRFLKPNLKGSIHDISIISNFTNPNQIHMPRKNNFSDREDDILRRLAVQIPMDTKFFYKKLHKLFVQQVQKFQIEEQMKSLKAISLRHKFLHNCQKITWNMQLDRNMLNAASTPLKWRQIAERQPFKSCRINQDEIKKKFKTDMLRKFRALFNRGKFNLNKIQPSYVVFRQILNQEELKNLLSSNLIDDKQFQTLTSNIPYFKTSTYHQMDGLRSTRSQKSTDEMKKYIAPNTVIPDLIKSIYKVSEVSSKRILQQKYQKLQKYANFCGLQHDFQQNVKSLGHKQNLKKSKFNQASETFSPLDEMIFEESQSQEEADIPNWNITNNLQTPSNIQQKILISLNQEVRILQNMDMSLKKNRQVLVQKGKK